MYRLKNALTSAPAQQTCLVFLSFLVVGLTTASGAVAQPTFSKAFLPDTIGPGSVSTLQFTITNLNPVGPVSDVAFVDNLPAGVTIASPANAVFTCEGTLTAPVGGISISLMDGILPPGTTCIATVDVTSSTPGTHMNVTGNLTSDAGDSGTASADLTVATNRPGFLKSFSPDPIPLGGRSTLTFTIDNTANSANMVNLRFTDNLPPGMVVASPANVTNTCSGGIVTAAPGSNSISYTFTVPGIDASVAAFSSCAITVDVFGTAVGMLGNTTGELLGLNQAAIMTLSSGKAGDTLEVFVDPLALDKDFPDDAIPPGAAVTLEFTITNFNRFDPATDIAFTDDLDATLSGLVAVGLPLPDPCGPGSLLSGTSLLSLSGGNLGPTESCTFSVTLQAPAGVSGIFPNTTSPITGDILGSPVVGGPASEPLFIIPAPSLTKTFLDNPVGGGDTTTLEFTITNTSTADDATDIAFQDVFDPVLPTAAVLPPANPCGPGSATTFIPLGVNPAMLFVTGGNLGPGASCTFSITLNVAAGAGAGTYPNVTSDVTAMVAGEAVTGSPASDDLLIVAPPFLLKEFTDDPADPGGTVTLQFTLSLGDEDPADATAINFTDDLTATLAGLTAIGLPMNDVCGIGSQISGTTNLSFTGGSLSPGETCAFSVTLQVPAGATPGAYPNTTSAVEATVLGETAVGNPATDNLRIGGLEFAKEFTDDPAIPGGTVNLQFTIDNISPTEDATGIFFTDNLGSVLSGLTAIGLPMMNVCGAGSQIDFAATSLIFTGGNLLAGTSCTINLTLQVPAGASPGMYPNLTSGLSAMIGGSAVVFDAASDDLVVSVDQLSVAKTFIGSPVSPGDLVTLELTVNNLHPSQAATSIGFADDLGTTLPGLAAVGLPMNDVCGAGSQISGAGVLTLTGGNLAPLGSCTFSVTLQVPAGAPGGTFTNVTSAPTGLVGGLPVSGFPGTADLRIINLAFSKAFAGPAPAGGTVTLTFTIENLDATSSADGLSFLDDLDAALSGMVATGLPAADVCGTGSQISGTSLLTFTNGSLGPGATCVINVTVQVPAGATPGDYLNTTSELFLAGLPTALPATATLGVEPPPLFSKAFAPDVIGVGGVSTLTFAIDNTASALAATGLDFTDNLPAGLVVATPANASTTCGGAVTAVSGSGVISFTGGTATAGATCTVQADVTSTTDGTFVNTTGDLTSSLGNSGTASDQITVEPPPLFSKTFAPDVIGLGGVSTLTFTIDNTANTLAATGLDFTDNLPAGVVVATPANASTTCGAGTVTAVAGSGVVSLVGGTVAGGASCTAQADVTSAAGGTYVNTSGDLTSSLGNSGAASDELTVVDAMLSLSKAFTSTPVLRGGLVDLELTLTNLSSTFTVIDIAFTDDLDAALPGLVAVGLPAADVCGAGSQLTGTSVVSLTGGSLAPSGSCTFSVTLQLPADAPLGVLTNTTSAVTATAAGVAVGALPASADLEVVFLEIEKVFDGNEVLAGSTTLLTFTLRNPDPVNAATDVTFSDDLEAVLPGLAAVDVPQSDVCGAGSLLDGASLLTLTGGILPPSGACTFGAMVLVPASTLEGDYQNVTSPVQATVAAGPVVGDAGGVAQAVLTVLENAVAIPALGPVGLALLAGLLLLLGLAKLRSR